MTLASGLTLSYAEQGDRSVTSLVLVHGLADSWRIFGPVLAHLPESIHALVPTQRGHGDASKPAAGYRSSDFSADLLGFLDALSIESAVIAGGSSGGLVAQRFAIDHPERTLGLVLLGAPLRLGDKELVRQLYDDIISRLRDPIGSAFVREFNEQIAQHVEPELFESLVEENLKAPAHVWRQVYEGAMIDDFSAELQCMTEAGMARVSAARENGSWDILTDTDNLVMPDDLASALAASPIALANFDAFSPSERKMYIYWVATAKRPETRSRRIAETVSLAAQNRKRTDRQA